MINIAGSIGVAVALVTAGEKITSSRKPIRIVVTARTLDTFFR
jgi:hypothetical protein